MTNNSKLLTLPDGMTMRLDTVVAVSPVQWTRESAYIGWNNRSPFYVVRLAHGEPIQIWHDKPDEKESQRDGLAPLARVLSRETFIAAWERAIAINDAIGRYRDELLAESTALANEILAKPKADKDLIEKYGNLRQSLSLVESEYHPVKAELLHGTRYGNYPDHGAYCAHCKVLVPEDVWRSRCAAMYIAPDDCPNKP